MTHANSNIQRAAWAADALNRFAQTTWATSGIDRMHPQDQSDAIADLITDLLHLAHLRGLHPDRLIAQAQMHFDAELQEERP